MPSVTVRGRTPRGRGTAPGPSTFQELLLQGMQTGADPFAGLSQAERTALATSPSYQTGAWKGPAQAQLSQQIFQAIRALQTGAGSPQPAIQLAIQAAAMLGALGGLTHELEGGMNALQRRAVRQAGQPIGAIGANGGIPQLPAPVRTFSLAGPSMALTAYTPPGALAPPSISDPTIQLLAKIEADVRPTARLLHRVDEDVRSGAVTTAGVLLQGGWTVGGGGGGWGGGGWGGGGRGGGPWAGWNGPGGPGAWWGFGGGLGGAGAPLGGWGGGGGGGGGGGVAGGGGWRRGPALPFAGALGLAATSRALTGALGLGIGAAIAAEIVEELALSPQMPGRVMGQALAAGQPFMNLTMQAMGLARAGSWDPGTGRGLRNRLYTGFTPPAWMQALGLGPQEALDLVTGFGVVPTDVTGQGGAGVAMALGGMQYLPGLGNLPQARQSAALAARYGLVAPEERAIRDYSMLLSHVMEGAVARGLDRASVLQSIDTAVSVTARGGAGALSIPGIADYLLRFAALPGGRTGEFGLQAMQGLQGAMGTVGQDPLRTMMVATASMNLRTEGQLRGFLTKQPGMGNYYDRFVSTAQGRRAVDLYLMSVRKGDWYSAARWMNVITQGNPGAQQELLSQSQFLAGLPEQAGPLVGGAITGLGPMGFMSPATGGTGIGTAEWSGSYGYDSSKVTGYLSGLNRMGITEPGMQNAVLTAAMMYGLDPMLIGGIIMQETTAGRTLQSWGPGISPEGLPFSQNLMGVTGGTARAFGLPALSSFPARRRAWESIMQGARILQGKIAQAHGDVTQGLANYGPGGFGYANKVMGFAGMGGAFGNVPGDMLQDRALAMAGVMKSSEISYVEMNAIITAAAHGLSEFASVVEQATHALAGLLKAMKQPGARPGPPQIPGLGLAPGTGPWMPYAHRPVH